MITRLVPRITWPRQSRRAGEREVAQHRSLSSQGRQRTRTPRIILSIPVFRLKTNPPLLHVSSNTGNTRPVPSSLPTLVEATVLSSKSIKLHWTISYSPEREIIEGFFVGYRSFETGAPPSVDGSQTGAPSISLPGANPKHSPTLGEQPTFTYKTIRLTSRPGALTSQEAGSEARQQQLSETGGAALLSPVASITKTIHPAGSPFSGGPQTALHRQQHPQLAGSASPLNVVVSSFEYVIGSLERNTEYTILIQCFNKKGAGPTSDPVVFRTFMNGKSPDQI